jgi:hypothetical protein
MIKVNIKIIGDKYLRIKGVYLYFRRDEHKHTRR